MFDKFDVLDLLRERAVKLNDNNLNKLPYEHKNTSLESGAKCDISYHQGYRDGIQSLLSTIDTWWHNEHDEMEEEFERMYLEHLRDRCKSEYAKDGQMIDVNYMSKNECIKFLKEKKVWFK